MGLSRIFGAYMAERAERGRRLKEMEEATNNNVDPIIFFLPTHLCRLKASKNWRQPFVIILKTNEHKQETTGK